MPGWKKICCAVDLSACSYDAVRAAATLARQLDAELVLFHAWVREPMGASEALFAQPELREETLLEDRRLLEGWQRLAAEVRGSPVEMVLEPGRNPARAIAAFANRAACDLLVLGTHGRRGLGRALRGSVAAKTSRLARCSLLIVRPTPEEVASSLGALAT